MKNKFYYLIRTVLLVVLLFTINKSSFAKLPTESEMQVSTANNDVVFKVLLVQKDGDDECIEDLIISVDGSRVMSIHHLSSSGYSNYFYNYPDYEIGWKDDICEYYYKLEGKWSSANVHSSSIIDDGENIWLTFKVSKYYFPLENYSKSISVDYNLKWKEYDTNNNKKRYKYYPRNYSRSVNLKEDRIASDAGYSSSSNLNVRVDSDEKLKVRLKFADYYGDDKSIETARFFIKENGSESEIFSINYQNSYGNASPTLLKNSPNMGYNSYSTFKLTNLSGWNFSFTNSSQNTYTLTDDIAIPVSQIPKKYHGKQIEIYSVIEWVEYKTNEWKNKKLKRTYEKQAYPFYVNIPDLEAFADNLNSNYQVTWDENLKKIDIKYLVKNTTGGIGSKRKSSGSLVAESNLNNPIITIDGTSISNEQGIVLKNVTEGNKTYTTVSISKISPEWFGKNIDVNLSGALSLGSSVVKNINVTKKISIGNLINSAENITGTINCKDKKVSFNFEWNKGSYYDSEIEVKYKSGEQWITIPHIVNSQNIIYVSSSENGIKYPADFKLNFKVKLNEFCNFSTQSYPLTLSNNFDPKIWDDDHTLTVSKGYYRDKVKLEWNPKETSAEIVYKILRKNLSDKNSDFEALAETTAKKYNDKDAIPGNYYEYRVFGVSECEDESESVKAIGFRLSTCHISGNVSFNNDYPEEGVKVSLLKEDDLSRYSLTGTKDNVWASVYVKHLEKIKNTKELSVGLWYKPESRNEGILLSIGQNGELSDAYLQFGFNENKPYIKIAGENIYLSSQKIEKTEFTQLYFTIGKEHVKIYVNGELNMLQERDNSNELDLPDNTMIIGHSFDGNIDEVSLWGIEKNSNEIEADFSRYLTGAEKDLLGYWSFEEGIHGVSNHEFNEFYDSSKDGVEFNKQDGKVEAGKFSSLFPSENKLSFCAITNQYGSYNLSFPSKGNLEIVTIKPELGIHKFSPAQKMIGVSEINPVHNDVNFKDVSSFRFSGRALFKTYGVFDYDKAPEKININKEDVTEVNNKYYIGADIVKNKGEYYIDFSEGDDKGKLYKCPVIPVKKAQVYVDNKPILDNGQNPVLTDENGRFSIQVPIGNHYISVKKDGHKFIFNGQFPEPTPDNEYTKHYFNKDISNAVFIDTTHITILGRVLGGSVQTQKTLGFGNTQNNIGQAKIIFSYNDRVDTDEILSVKTDAETGEYKAKLPPIDNIYIKSVKIINDKLSKITFDEVKGDKELAFNLSSYTNTKKLYLEEEGEKTDSVSYNRIKNFIFRSKPQLIIENKSRIGQKVIETKKDTLYYSNTDTLLFNSNTRYKVIFKAYEEYINYDSNKTVLEEVKNGNVTISNNLAIDNNSKQITADEKGSFVHEFYAGVPDINCNLRKLTAVYSSEGVATDDNAKRVIKGVLLGDIPKSGSNFITSGPVIPKFILRDPPGTNSYAYISEGTTLTTSSSMSVKDSHSHKVGGSVSIKKKFLFIEEGANAEASVSYSAETTNGRSYVETITTKTTIKTSDEFDFVGASGDLYYGQSLNYGLKKTDKVIVAKTKDVDNPEGLVKVPGHSDYVFTNKEAIMLESATDPVWYVYSQNHIINYLIPSYLNILRIKFNTPEADLKKLVETTFRSEKLSDKLLNKSEKDFEIDDDYKDNAQWYKDQIKIWQQTIAANEMKKHKAFNNNLAESLKSNINKKIEDLKKNLKKLKHQITDDDYEGNLWFSDMQKTVDKQIRNYRNNLQKIEENSKKNISFDAGLGEYASELETTTVVSDTYEWSAETEIGASINFSIKVGPVTIGVNNNNTWTDQSGGSNEITTQKSTTYGYVLKDANQGDYLNVDVYDDMSGNGPIFVTRGGQTSCPHEAETRTSFYVNDGKHEVISSGTLQREKPAIRVLGVAEKSGVPDNIAAEFTIELENLSETEDNVWYQLEVDRSTNPDGAILKIDGAAPNGLFMIKHGEPILKTLTVRKGKADVNSYNKIGLILHSTCQFYGGVADWKDIADTTFVSVDFIPTCSDVAIAYPKDNWVVNLDKSVKNNNNVLITLDSYNKESVTFKRIELNYRSKNSAKWNTLATFYNNPDDVTLAEIATDDSKFTIEDINIDYNWNIENLIDGSYEIQACTYCSDGSETLSPVVMGTIDRKLPQIFGTPSPANGILSPSDDILVTFNEDILQANINSDNVKVKYTADVFDKNHPVSALFNNDNRGVKIKNPLVNGSFTFEFWARKLNSGKAIILKQGNSNVTDMEIGFDAENYPYITIGKNVYTAETKALNSNTFQHYTFIFNSKKEYISIYQNSDNILDRAKCDINYQSSENILLGHYFKGNIKDLKYWNKALFKKDINIYNVPTGYEFNLSGYWPFNEGSGEICFDKAQNNHAVTNAEWEVTPKGISAKFNGNQIVEVNASHAVLTNEADFTLEFWFKTGLLQNATLISNGHANGNDFGEDNIKSACWSINTENDGYIYFYNNGTKSKAINTQYNDSKWHHFAMVVNRLGNIKTYLDGEAQNSVSSIGYGGFYSNFVTVGARKWFTDAINTNTDMFYTGYIDEVKLWNISKSEKQINRDLNFMTPKTEEFILINLPFQIIKNDGTSTVSNNNFNYVENSNLTNPEKLLVNTSEFDNNVAPLVKPAQPKILLDNYSIIASERKIFIKPNNFGFLQGKVLDISVNNIKDIYSNRMSSAVTWTALVDKNQLKWGEQHRTISIKYETGYKFTTRIINKGGVNMNYKISGNPDWIKVHDNKGNINSNSYTDIEIEIKKGVNIGQYNEILYLEGDNGLREKLNLVIDISKEAPGWKVDKNKYSSTMGIVGILKIDDIISSDKNDIVAAFIDNECRGVGKMKYIEQIDSYCLFIDIYGDIEETGEIRFKAWDANPGEVLAEVSPNLNFLANDVKGNVSNPIIFNAELKYELAIDLNAGWNWFSFNLSSDNQNDINKFFENSVIADNTHIKSHNSEFATYKPSVKMWKGTLKSLSNTNMYMINVSEPSQLFISGARVDVENTLITINKGWNMISFLPGANQSVSNALGSLTTISAGDIIKGQNGFAIYDERLGWVGSLEYMKPGNGYMLKATNNGVLSYRDVSFNRSNNRKLSQASTTNFSNKGDWNNSGNMYAYNMSVIAKVEHKNSAGTSLAAFVNGECRGITEAIYVNNEYLYFISIANTNSSDKITFRYLDNNMISSAEANQSIEFVVNNVVGTLEKPLLLTFNENISNTDNSNPLSCEVKCHPNPFTKYINIEIKGSNSSKLIVDILDVNGRKITNLYNGVTNNGLVKLKWNGLNDAKNDVSSGTYIVRINNSGSITTKLIQVVK